MHTAIDTTGVSYDMRLVALSYVIAVFASYTTLDLVGRIVLHSGRARVLLLIAGAVAMGIGIWSMHFTGMLASSMNTPLVYDLPFIIISMLIGVLTSAFVLFHVSRHRISAAHLIGSGCAMGLGIAAMHYIGVAAMCNSRLVSYNPFLFAASVGIAIAASIGGLWMAFQLRSPRTALWSSVERKLGSALVLGSAIAGMHYTSMAAAVFTPKTSAATSALSGAFHLPQLFACGFDPIMAATPIAGETISLGFSVGLGTMVLLGLGLFTSFIHQCAFQETTKLLNDTEAQYKALFNRDADTIYSCNLDGIILDINPAIAHLLGYEAHELIRTPFRCLVAAQDVASAEAAFSRATQGQRHSFEVTMVTRAGRQVELHITNAPLMIGDMVVGVYGVAKEVSEQKRVAVALRQSEDHLYSLVQQKQELANTVHTFSTTAVHVYDGILLMPTVGLVDAPFSEWHIQALRSAIEEHQALVILIDVSHLCTISQDIVAGMARVIHHAATMGAQSIVIDGGAEIESMLIGYGTPANALIVCDDLRKGIDDAMTMVEQHQRSQNPFRWHTLAPTTA